MQIVRYVMWIQLVGQRPETAWAALSWSSVWLRKAEMCFCVHLNVCFPVAPPGLQQPAWVTQIFIVPESTTDEKGCLWQRMMEREAGQFLCVWVCVINPQRDLSCRVSLSVCVFLFWDLTVRFSVSCACGRRVAPLWPVPTASSLWNAWHSRCLPNELLKKTC